MLASLTGLVPISPSPVRPWSLPCPWQALSYTLLPNLPFFIRSGCVDTFPRPNPSMASVYLQTQRHALDRDTEPRGREGSMLLPPPQAHVFAVLCNLIRAPTKASCSLLFFFSPPLPLSFKVHLNSSFTKTDFPGSPAPGVVPLCSHI